jgi:hypothetical protein
MVFKEAFPKKLFLKLNTFNVPKTPILACLTIVSEKVFIK